MRFVLFLFYMHPSGIQKKKKKINNERGDYSCKTDSSIFKIFGSIRTYDSLQRRMWWYESEEAVHMTFYIEKYVGCGSWLGLHFIVSLNRCWNKYCHTLRKRYKIICHIVSSEWYKVIISMHLQYTTWTLVFNLKHATYKILFFAYFYETCYEFDSDHDECSWVGTWCMILIELIFN